MKLRKYITSSETINERLIKVNLNIRGNKLAVQREYIVNDDALVNIKNYFFEKLHAEIIKIGGTREILILEDLFR